MDILEFKKQITYLAEGCDGHKVAVPVMGGIGGPRSYVKSVSVGFDWYHNTILINTQEDLTRLCPRKYSFYKQEYLKTISNLAAVQRGSKEARFRDVTLAFERCWEAEVWLYQKLAEEEKQKL